MLCIFCAGTCPTGSVVDTRPANGLGVCSDLTVLSGGLASVCVEISGTCCCSGEQPSVYQDSDLVCQRLQKNAFVEEGSLCARSVSALLKYMCSQLMAFKYSEALEHASRRCIDVSSLRAPPDTKLCLYVCSTQWRNNTTSTTWSSSSRSFSFGQNIP